METDDPSNDHSDKKILKLWEYKKQMTIHIIEKTQKVGYIRGVLLDVSNIFNELKGDEALKVLKFEDKEDEEEIKSFFVQVLSRNKSAGTAFYITELFIEKGFRGQGLGKKIFQVLPDFLHGISKEILYIYLMPGPLEKIDGKVEYIMNPKDEKMVALKNRLIKFYESVGFSRIEDTDFFKEKVS
ncbi:hypothetical protein [Lutispora saccharofermentans]|uniref:N-acetyltransferase domain-containing protein n=1 Tax=Lutispora saccharofermentans TaxID=3024236 RepID=A0ABT1NG32_9FIRM|nr:hypothetical protein [Lutispora saccharofermentans]MCQ1530232.1 hypothetical protein [Lutispora saccharofermentans]